MKKIIILILSLVLCSMPVYAAEIEEGEIEDVLSVSAGDSLAQYVLEFPESIATYEVNEDDYNYNQASTYDLRSDVYAGSYNSTIISIWNGLLNNNVGKDYVAFRSSQYDYYIFFGEDFQYNGNTFSGSGTFYSLNTYSNGYAYTSGTDTFSITVSSGYLYTNVSPDFPSLENDRGLIYEQIQTILLIALLAFYVFRWIFIAR